MKLIWQALFFITVFLYTLSFISSFCMFRFKGIDKKIKWLFLYSSVAFVFSIPAFVIIIQNFKLPPLFIYINNLSLLFHFLFFSTFIFYQLRSKINQKIVLVLIAISLLGIFYLLITENTSTFNYHAFAISSLSLVAISVFYYIELFTYPPVLNLLKEPVFWLVTGVFVSMGLNLPYNATKNFKIISTTSYLSSLFIIIGHFGYSVLHIFLIKTYICAIQNRRI